MSNYIVYPKEFRKMKIPVEKNTCFFLMPFDKRFDGVYGEIKERLSEIEINCSRVDELTDSYPIINNIIRKIIGSQFIIVDLTTCNPNVFYELGIAHTFKEARNILLIKEKNEKTPFDISHLKYIEYSRKNLKKITSTIINFIEENKNISEFYDILNINGIINIIDENSNAKIEALQSYLKEDIVTATNILNNELSDIGEKDINSLFQGVSEFIKDVIRSGDFWGLEDILQIYYSLVKNAYKFDIANKYIADFLDLNEVYLNVNSQLLLSWKTDFATLLAESDRPSNIALSWIIDYFKKSKSSSIDLNRYKLESLLINSNSKEINSLIISSLKHHDCHIREHMADIIGEKKLNSALNNLCDQLTNEDNYFTATSIISAIGKIGTIEDIHCICEWLNRNHDKIIETEQFFVLNHARISIQTLDTSCNKIHVNSFEKRYAEILKNNFIL